MADNVQVTPGSGADPQIATDEVGGVHYQKVKLCDGTAESAVAAKVTGAGALQVDGSAVTQPVSFPSGVTVVQPSAVELNATVSGTVAASQSGAWTVTADAGTGPWPVTDNGGSITVDGTVTANIGTTSGVALDATLTSGAQATKLVDGGGDSCMDDANDALRVNVVAGASSGAPSVTDDAAFSVASAQVSPIGAMLDDTASDSVNEGDAGILRMSANRNLYSQIRDAAGNERGANVTAANALKVDGSAVTQPVSGTVTANAGAGPWPVTDNGGSLTVDGTVAATQSGGWSVSVSGTPSVTLGAALPSGTNNIGDVDIASSLPAGSNTIGNVGLAPQTSGGLSIGRVISAGSTNATSVKASAGQVFGIYAHNINAAVRYLKLYNKASAPTVGSDTPVLTLPIPGNTAGAGFVLEPSNGIAFSTGIALALTTGVADSNSTAVAANEIVVNLLYK